MADIRHRVGITGATAAQAYEALATTGGLAGWWTRTVDGDPAVGGDLKFYFEGSEPGAVMRVTGLVPGQRVSWQCTGGPDEWVGTTLSFDLAEADGETVVMFTQAGWREPVPFMHHCSTKWAVFLLSLKAGLERGAATPYPDDQTVSSWS